MPTSYCLTKGRVFTYKLNQEKYVNMLFLLLLFEIIAYSLSNLFMFSIDHKRITLTFGFSLIMGNLFLINSLLLNNMYQMCLYSIFYIYTLTLMVFFVFDEMDRILGVCFTCVSIMLFLLRGLVLVIKFREFMHEFEWYHYKKIGCEQRINGKCCFLI